MGLEYDIGIEIDGTHLMPDEWFSLDDRLRTSVRRTMSHTLETFTVEEVRRQLKKHDIHPVSSSPLWKSISWDFKVESDTADAFEMRGRVYPKGQRPEKAFTLEEGRSAGVGSMPPDEDSDGEGIEPWVDRILRYGGDWVYLRGSRKGQVLTEEQVVFLVRRKLQRDGQDSRPFMEDALYHISRGLAPRFKEDLDRTFD